MLSRTTKVCAAVAALSAGGLSLAGHPLEGTALAAGLLVGSLNGFLATRSLTAELDFRVTSMGRLLLLSAVAVGLGALIAVSTIPFVVLGVAFAQLVLAGVAAREVIRG